MNRPPSNPTAHPITRDQPLPGFYPVLTLQLNVTRYANQRMGRMVLVVREPAAQIEVGRSFLDVANWEAVTERTDRELAAAFSDMRWLQDGTTNT